MSESATVNVDPPDPYRRDRALGSTGLLAAFNEHRVVSAADVHVARRLGAVLGESDEAVLLATALVTAAVRNGSVRLDLSTVAAGPFDDDAALDLPWPEPEDWTALVAASRLVGEQVLRLDDGALYLDRYWREELQVHRDLVDLLHRTIGGADGEGVLDRESRVAAAERVLPDVPAEKRFYAEQREAAVVASGQAFTVLTGGPGTGKTTAVAAMLAVVAEQFQAEHARSPRIALAAPTGKAAARLQQSVRDAIAGFGPDDVARIGPVAATTLHRLLGWIPDSNVRFRHHRANPLPYDVVVVDETSMMSLSMTARVLEALSGHARLLLVGDPDQLASVEAGAVLTDVVQGLRTAFPDRVCTLGTNHRNPAAINTLAQALRNNDPDQVLASLSNPEQDVVVWARPDDEEAMAAFRAELLADARVVRDHAVAGRADAALAALDGHRLLCAHRNGPYGVNGWNREVERLLADATGDTHYDEWYLGRPVLVTANDRSLGLYNGDMGVVIADDSDGPTKVRVAVGGADGLALFAPTRLPQVQTMHALTVHKSQGSQARTVSVVMPPADSALLTRELFYTAVTRAEEKVRIVGDEAEIVAAVQRHVRRASGLEGRLDGTVG